MCTAFRTSQGLWGRRLENEKRSKNGEVVIARKGVRVVVDLKEILQSIATVFYASAKQSHAFQIVQNERGVLINHIRFMSIVEMFVPYPDRIEVDATENPLSWPIVFSIQQEISPPPVAHM